MLAGGALGLAKHVQGDPAADRRLSSDPVHRLLHLAMPAVAPFHRIGGRTEQAIVQAQVSAVGTVDTSGDSVDVLVYLNQYRRNANVTGEKVDQDRVLLTLVRAGRDCKVSRAAAI